MEKIESLESQVAFLQAATERKQMQLTIARQEKEIELLYAVQSQNEKEYFKLKKALEIVTISSELNSLAKDLLNSRKAEPKPTAIVNGSKRFELGSWVYSYTQQKIIGQIVEIKDNFCVGLSTGGVISIEKHGSDLEPFTEKELSTGKIINSFLLFPDGKILKVGNTICWKKEGKIKILGKIISFLETDSEFLCETKKGNFSATDVFKLEK